MKKIIIVLFTVVLCCTMLLPAFAEGDVSRLNDEAGLFTADEAAALLAKQDALSEKYSVDILVLVTNGYDGDSLADYSESYMAEHGFDNCMMFMLDIATNKFYTSAAGRCAQLLDEDGYALLDDAFINTGTTYAEGVDGYLDACDTLLSDMENTTVESLPLLIDNADLLSAADETELDAKLTEISDRLACDVIVLTEASIDKDAQAYADDYFDYSGYGRGAKRDGILILVSMDPRAWHVSGSGICNSEYISTDALEYISENVVTNLQSEAYANCFDEYAERCDEVITDARNGKAYKLPFNTGMSIVVSLAIGFIVAFIATGSMKSKLKSVAAKKEANSYLKPGSLMITDSRDMFLYRQVTYTEKSNDSDSSNDSHTSSSGRSHSGTGGSF